MKLNNKYYIIRHGEAQSNVKDIVSCYPEKIKNPLTKHGKEMIKESAQKLKTMTMQAGKNIDLIFCSPLLRTKQTAEIISKILKVKVKHDKRLTEINFGIFNFSGIKNIFGFFKKEEDRINAKPPKGESYAEIIKRMWNFFVDVNKKYKRKTILIVSHEGPLLFLEGKVMGLSLKETIKKFPNKKRIHKGEIRELN
jgi:broad specificity phosphatase PhoE